jgi:glucosamine-6-phosphate deaminase
MAEPRIDVVPDHETMSQRAADVVTATLRAKPDAAISLPTGSTPERMFEIIAERARAQVVDLSRFQLFCLDEYIGQSRDDPNSLTHWLFEKFVEPAGMPQEHVHALPTQAVDLDAAAASYEQEISDAGGLELAVLGIGGNGHIAYNEPDSAATSRTRVVRLTPESLSQAEGYFAGQQVPDVAMTVGVATLLEARAIVLIASGAGKAEIIRRAFREPMSADVPASWLRLAPEKVTVILDEAVAALL